MSDDDKLARAYRALAKEEPPAALDARVLEAARRAARPPAARRWGVPVSIAAVLVIAAGLVLEMRSQQPGIETAPHAASAPARARKAEQATSERKKSDAAADLAAPPYAPRRPAGPVAEPPPSAQAGAAPPPAAAPAVTRVPPVTPTAAGIAPYVPGEAMRAAPFADSNAAAAPALQTLGATTRGPFDKRASVPGDAPAELEAIAKLRAAGRDAEADSALQAFRASHPGYVVPEAIMRRVQPR